MATTFDLGLAHDFVIARTKSLVKDVGYCVAERYQNQPGWPAPFPALLYCFSTIDLLGALCGGDAGKDLPQKSPPTARQAREYMRRFMKCTPDQVKLLQDQFRHKLVHLAEPKASVRHNGKTYLWMHHHDDRAIHLRTFHDGTHDRFGVAILPFAEDIRDSTVRPGGYLDELAKDSTLQTNFLAAHVTITGP